MEALLTEIFYWVSLLSILGTLAGLLGHYILFGPPLKKLPQEPTDVKRMSGGERILHGSLLLGCVTLATTGFIGVLALREPISGWLRACHVVVVPLFVVGLAGASLRWAYTCRFKSYDWEWAKKFGGYLWRSHNVPAGKFNAGQKAYFWMVLCLGIVVTLSGLGRAFPMFDAKIQLILLQVHRYSALFLLLSVLSHIYLGTLANPGTIQVIVTGRVKPTWARHHHPIWWETLHEKEGAEQGD